ncbi:MAG: glycosyltransferase 87 family protein [Cellulomonas sp.]|nr:glycosyltransferase 87 family protein [Cellulomonas sp.]
MGGGTGELASAVPKSETGPGPRQRQPLSQAGIRFAKFAVPLSGLAMVSTSFASSYGGIAPTELLSYVVDDMWCDTSTQAIGLHCFGDYALVDDLFGTGDPWHSALSGNASWPAAAWLPAILAYRLGALIGVGWVGGLLFSVVSILAMLSPAWWATRHCAVWIRASALTLGGAATAPFIATIDRGNPVGLTVPLLLWAGVAYGRRQWVALTCAVVGASLLKPQMIVLLLLPLLHRRYRCVVLGGAASAALTVAGFLAFPRAFPGNALAWVHEIVNRTGDYQPLNQVYPYNIGIGRSFLTLLDVTGVGTLIGADHRQTAIGVLTIAGPSLLVAAAGIGALALWRGRSRLGTGQSFALALLVCLYTSSTVYLYYLVVLLVALALLVRDPVEHPGTECPERGRWHSRWGSLAAIALIMAPVVVPVPARWFGRSVVSFGQVEILTVSLWQVMVGPLVLAWFGWLIVTSMWPPHALGGSSGSRLPDPSVQDMRS